MPLPLILGGIAAVAGAVGVEETAAMFDLLLGDDLQGRKQFIAEYGHAYLELADIS